MVRGVEYAEKRERAVELRSEGWTYQQIAAELGWAGPYAVFRALYPERVKKYRRGYRAAVKRRVFDHYGQACACCGSMADLTIDHVGGGGTAHRIELFGREDPGGWAFYQWLVGERFPAGFQTLCRRCNTSKGQGERCRLVHQRNGEQLMLFDEAS